MKKFNLDFSQALTQNVKVSVLRDQISWVHACVASLTACRLWECENEARILVSATNELICMNARMNENDRTRKMEMLLNVQRKLDEVYA